MRSDFLLVLGTAIMTVVMVSTAAAQSTTNPPGAVGGLFGVDGPVSQVRTTQQLSTWFDIGGGYDQTTSAGGSVQMADLRGYATTFLVAARYWRGRTTRSIEATSRVFRNQQRTARATAEGGEAGVIGNLGLGRRGGMNVALRAASDSSVLFGAFGAATPVASTVDPGIDVPDVGPQQGSVDDRWYSLGANASVYRNWTSRQRTTTRYSQVRREPTQGGSAQSDQRLGELFHEWTFRPNFGLLTSYRIERVEQTLGVGGSPAPYRAHAAEGGFRYERRLTPLRTVSATIQAGVTKVLATPSSVTSTGTIEPTGSVATSYILARRWALLAGASRSVTVLQGLSQLPFTNNVASLSVNGVMLRRVTVSVTGAVSQGVALASGPGSFTAAGTTSTVRYGFRYGGLFAAYTRYEHRVLDVAISSGGVAARIKQSSMRVGVTLWLPLFGSF